MGTPIKTTITIGFSNNTSTTVNAVFNVNNVQESDLSSHFSEIVSRLSKNNPNDITNVKITTEYGITNI